MTSKDIASDEAVNAHVSMLVSHYRVIAAQPGLAAREAVIEAHTALCMAFGAYIAATIGREPSSGQRDAAINGLCECAGVMARQILDGTSDLGPAIDAAKIIATATLSTEDSPTQTRLH